MVGDKTKKVESRKIMKRTSVNISSTGEEEDGAGEVNISTLKQDHVPGVDKVDDKTRNVSNVRVTVAGTFDILEKVSRVGKVDEESRKELDVTVTRAGRFDISEKVPRVDKVDEETRKEWVTAAGIFKIYNLEKVLVWGKKNSDENLDESFEDIEDDFQPEIVNVWTDGIKSDAKEESMNYITIKWNVDGGVTFIRRAEPVEDDDIIFLGEITSK